MNSAIFGGAYEGSVIDGRFPLVRCLGGTANGSVFLTQIAGDANQKAAIKLLRASGLDADTCLSQWNQAMELSHPHLVRMIAAGRCQVGGEDALYTVMEYADEVLAEVLPERALTQDEVSEMLPPVLDALGWLHARGLVHNRVKPTNLLAVGDKLKLSVDGIQAAGSTRLRALTSAYDAPEIAAGSVSAASDVWALGVTVVETLTQRTLDWMRTTGTDPVVAASVPQPFFEIARRCLRADPAARCTIAEIQNILSPGSAAAPAPQRAQPKTSDSSPKKRRMQLWVLGAAAVALLAIVVGTKLNTPHSEQPNSPETQASAPQAQPMHPQPEETPTPEGPVVQGTVAYRAEPEVPEFARRTIRGHVPVAIRAEVDASGNVTRATVDSSGPSRYFPKLALQTAQDWKFKPAMKGGQPVSSVWVLHFEFDPDQTLLSAEEVTP